MHISLDSALGQQRRLNQVGESITQIAPDPAAAYSLRSLTGGDPKVVRVRRGSDNHEQDFTASEVSSGALTSFVNAQVVAPLDIQALSATGRDGDFLIAKAAYSLRSLGTRQATVAATGDTVARADGKYVCQVRRSSDDALKSFTAAEVTDGTLLAFTNEDVVVYSSDYSSGTDSWAFSGGSLAAPQSIGGEDNALKVTKSGDGFFFPQKTGVLVSGETYSISLKLYAPSDNTNSNLNFNVRESGGGTVLDCNLTEANAWQSFTVSLTSSTTQVLQVTSDVSMTSGDVLYIKDFVVTQTSNSSGFVKTWYDQSVSDQAGAATGNHAVQATAGSQPKIVDAGSLVTLGVDFTDGKFMTFTSISAKTVVSVNQLTSTTNLNYLVGKNLGDGGVRTGSGNGIFQGADTGTSGSADFNNAGGSTHVNGGQSSFLSTSKNLYFGTATSGFALSSIGTGFVFSGSSRSWRGKIAEVIIYDTDQSDNRIAIEANIGEAYSIDLPSGVDPGFDQVDGFVETWYDQSGNSNDAVQATAANQPKIVDAGSLVSGGLDFDGTNDFLPIPLTGHNIGNLSSFCVGKFDSASGNSDVMLSLGTGTDSSRWYGPWANTSNIRYGYGSASDAIAEFAASTDVKLHTLIAGTTIGNASGFENGTLKGTATRSTATAAGTFGIGGVVNATSFPLDGKVQEVIVYESDQSDNRTAVETNINNQYSIF